MGWSIGYDAEWDRDIGYGVPAWCDQPDCTEEIDRGLAFVCGGEPYGGERGCGLYFCSAHLWIVRRGSDTTVQLCSQCAEHGEDPDDTLLRAFPLFPAKPDHPTWVRFKLEDPSWQQWRDEHPAKVEAMRATLVTP